MNADDISMLLAVFWIGLSISYMILTWAWQVAAARAEPESGSLIKKAHSGIPYAIRIALSVIGISGAFGAETLTVYLKNQLIGVDVVVLGGFAVGILLALAMRKYPAIGASVKN